MRMRDGGRGGGGRYNDGGHRRGGGGGPRDRFVEELKYSYGPYPERCFLASKAMYHNRPWHLSLADMDLLSAPSTG